MDSQPLPSAPSGYGSGLGAGGNAGSDRRAFSSQPSWSGGDRPARGGMNDRGASYGMSLTIKQLNTPLTVSV